jgi:hypothetical protein
MMFGVVAVTEIVSIGLGSVEMATSVAIRVRTAFGLAFDIEKAPERKSGFKPAEVDLSSRKKLFGNLRLKGFAAALQSGFARSIILVGGLEGRYPDEAIGRATAIRKMLLEDCGIPSRRVDALQSAPNTGGNVNIIKARIREEGLVASECALLSNHYHLPRVQMDLRANRLALQLYPAEAFLLLKSGTPEDRKALKRQLVTGFGDGPLAERIAEEINGIADKISGVYANRAASKHV